MYENETINSEQIISRNMDKIYLHLSELQEYMEKPENHVDCNGNAINGLYEARILLSEAMKDIFRANSKKTSKAK